ncbi:MAG TPA: hypothetical protein VF828_00015 [Patescibacteria group bacterium]
MKYNQSLKHLLVSKTRQKLLGILFYQPSEIYYVRQLVRLADEEINSVRRELENLKNADVVTSEQRGNRLYYQANVNSSMFLELLVLAHKSSGLGEGIQKNRDKVGAIKLIAASFEYLTGTKKGEGSIDMIIVGDISIREIDNLIKSEESRLQKEINYMVMDRSEFRLRKQKRDPFLVDFFLACPFILFGNPESLA